MKGTEHFAPLHLLCRVYCLALKCASWLSSCVWTLRMHQAWLLAFINLSEQPKFPVLKGTVRNGITQTMCLNGYHREKGLCNPTSVTTVVVRVHATIFFLAMVTGVLQAVCTSLPWIQAELTVSFCIMLLRKWENQLWASHWPRSLNSWYPQTWVLHLKRPFLAAGLACSQSWSPKEKVRRHLPCWPNGLAENRRSFPLRRSDCPI